MTSDAAPPRPEVTLLLTGAELGLIEHALRSYLSDFGHDEADVVHRIRELIHKVSAAAPAAG